MKHQLHTIGTCVVILLFAARVSAAKPYIDQEQLKNEQSIKEKVRNGCPTKPFGAMFKCSEKLHEEWNKTHPRRGSDEYCEMHYRSLSAAAAKAKVEELYSLANVARFAGKREPGEVTSGMFEGEATWIKINVLKAKIIDGRIK